MYRNRKSRGYETLHDSKELIFKINDAPSVKHGVLTDSLYLNQLSSRYSLSQNTKKTLCTVSETKNALQVFLSLTPATVVRAASNKRPEHSVRLVFPTFGLITDLFHKNIESISSFDTMHNLCLRV